MELSVPPSDMDTDSAPPPTPTEQAAPAAEQQAAPPPSPLPEEGGGGGALAAPPPGAVRVVSLVGAAPAQQQVGEKRPGSADRFSPAVMPAEKRQALQPQEHQQPPPLLQQQLLPIYQVLRV